MFERYTPRARRALVMAQEEARLLGQNFVGSEHVLVGLARAGGRATAALEAVGVNVEALRQHLEGGVRGTPGPLEGHGAFTADAKQVLQVALSEAAQLGHNYIGTEHLLLGLASVGGSAGAEALAGIGVTLAELRQAVLESLEERPGATGPLDAAATELSWRHQQYAGGYRARPLGPLACRPVVLTAVRALVWGAGVRGATRARWRTSLLVGGAIAAGSALFARGQRRGGWVLGPYRIGVGRAGGSSRTKQERPGSVPSPGGWEVPSGVLPMWDWTPPGGGQPRLDRVPTVVRAWYELPFLDRYAHAWMWRHGGWDVSPFPSSPAEDGPGAG